MSLSSSESSKPPDLRRVRKAIHHVGDAAVLEGLGDGLPAVLDELRGVGRVDALLDHLVEAQQRAGLEHAAEDGLLTHEVGLDLRDERRHQHPGFVATGADGVGLGEGEAFAVGVVVLVDGDEGRHAEATDVLGTHLGAGALGGDHDDGDVVTDLHALFDDVEAVRVRQAGAVFHHRHDRLDHVGVLLVRGEVEHDVGGGEELLVGADGEAVLGGVLPRLTLLGDGFLAEGVGDVQAAVAEVETLVEALGATADHDHLLFPREAPRRDPSVSQPRRGA